MGQGIIFLLITLFTFAFSLKSGEFRPLFTLPLLWLFYLGIILIGLQYKILWDENGVRMKAGGKKDVHIEYKHIKEVRLETATFGEFIIGSSPFRRIAIYGRAENRNDKINVSLRHFRATDINTLMRSIRQHRPDLPLPNY